MSSSKQLQFGLGFWSSSILRLFGPWHWETIRKEAKGRVRAALLKIKSTTYKLFFAILLTTTLVLLELKKTSYFLRKYQNEAELDHSTDNM